ncbi:hypothetical protein AB0I77_41895 [Streptomyces sp. NPDC050619]|uniref:hypothetical protein n=1 Tax=Streptomyces sp. NPDC050619 TaxID=3157214 RepID=UPI003446D10D
MSKRFDTTSPRPCSYRILPTATFHGPADTEATLNLDGFTQALVRRKLLGDDTYVSGIESGTEVFKGTGRLDTKAYSVDIG